MTDFAVTAHKVTVLAARVDTRVDHAAEWLDDHIADGYPTSTRGSEGAGGDPAHSPTLDAIETGRTLNIPILELEGLQTVDLRTVRLMLARAFAQAEDNLRWAQQILDAIPRQTTGQAAVDIDYQLRTGRCEGWSDQYALCEELAAKPAVVDGSTFQFCPRCLMRMRRETDPTPDNTGRVTRKEGVA